MLLAIFILENNCMAINKSNTNLKIYINLTRNLSVIIQKYLYTQFIFKHNKLNIHITINLLVIQCYK